MMTPEVTLAWCREFEASTGVNVLANHHHKSVNDQFFRWMLTHKTERSWGADLHLQVLNKMLDHMGREAIRSLVSAWVLQAVEYMKDMDALSEDMPKFLRLEANGQWMAAGEGLLRGICVTGKTQQEAIDAYRERYDLQYQEQEIHTAKSEQLEEGL